MKLTDEDEKYLLLLFKKRKIVEAVKFIKEKTGISLKEAKEYIDMKRADENAEFPEKNNDISVDDKEYIISLIQQDKKLQAVVFLHKERDMDLREAKDYVDREEFKNKITAKKSVHKRGYIFDEKLNILIPNLTRQKKALKIILNILLILIPISLIQLFFLDRTSYIKMRILGFSIVWIPILLILYFGLTLNIHFTEKKLKEVENLEILNEFEVKAFIKKFDLFLHILLLLIFIIVIPIVFVITYKKGEYKGILYLIPLIVITIYGIYELLKMFKYKKYLLNINNREISLSYNKNEIKSIKISNINFIKFYAKKLKKRRIANIPTIQIFDSGKNIFAEMNIKTSDYILLKKYFKKYEVLVNDEFNKL